MPACGCGKAPRCGSTRRSIKVSASRTRTASPDFRAAKSYKLGVSYPYARMQRYFLRQTIDLGGEIEKVDADINQFAGTQTANRLVLTVGKFAIVDIFDTNKYANNPKTDFLNWSLINAGTFDYAGDGWGYTYGAAAEWYQGSWTLRGGVFDLSATPAGGISPNGGVLDPTFQQYRGGRRKSRSATTCGASPARSRSPASSTAAGREVSGRHHARPDHRRARRHHGGATTTPAAPASA